MERRAFLIALPTIAAALKAQTLWATSSQDVEYIRAWERANQLRPRVLTPQARIAPVGEPGIPLSIAGRLFDRDGRTPVPGITIFAYHTDAKGHYDVAANGPHSWRLKGWAITDVDGRFQFDTIRPAPYPGRNVAAHIHVSLEGPKLKRRSRGLLFDDDPLVTREEREASTKDGQFGSVVRVVARDGRQHVDYRIRITDEGIF